MKVLILNKNENAMYLPSPNPQNYIFGIYIRNIHVKKAAFT